MRGLILIFAFIAAAQAAIPVNHASCGLRPRASVENDKVVGGHQAIVGDHGWMTAMRRNGAFICGCSVVDSWWAISAAHCTVGSANVAVYILDIGGHDRNVPENWVQSMRVQRLVNHQQYSSATLRNDISMLKFATEVMFDNNYIVPVCVPRGDEDWQSKSGWATGWGSLFSGGGVSRYLMQVWMIHLTDARCAQRFGTSVDTRLQMCGGEVGGGIDTCQGDSGGPYVFQSVQDGKWYLIGITSWGYGCGDGGVYTKTAGYYNWIINTIATN